MQIKRERERARLNKERHTHTHSHTHAHTRTPLIHHTFTLEHTDIIFSADPALQDGEDSRDALSRRSFSAKEPLIIGLFYVK